MDKELRQLKDENQRLRKLLETERIRHKESIKKLAEESITQLQIGIKPLFDDTNEQLLQPQAIMRKKKRRKLIEIHRYFLKCGQCNHGGEESPWTLILNNPTASDITQAVHDNKHCPLCNSLEVAYVGESIVQRTA